MSNCNTNAKCAFKICMVDTLPTYPEATTLYTLRDEPFKTFYCKKECGSGFDSFELGSGDCPPADCIVLTSDITIAGTTYIAGEINVQDILTLLAGLDHDPLTVGTSTTIDFTLLGQALTGEIAGVSTATVGQVPVADGAGNIVWTTPTPGTISVVTDNGDGTYSHSDGNGNTIVIDTNAVSNTISTDITIGGTTYVAGTATVQDVLEALTAANCEDPQFTINAGTTAASTDNSLGEEDVDCGDIVHFWSSDGSIDFNVTAGSAVIDIIVKAVSAAIVTYDNTVSGLTATNVQAAIDELAADSHADDDVETVTGTAVDNTDPRNPVIDLEITTGTGAPTGTTPISPLVYVDDATGDIYTYDGTTWNLQGGSTDTNVTAVSKTLNADRQLQVNVTEDGNTISSTLQYIGSPWLANNTNKPFINGLDSGDIFAPRNVYFDGNTNGISTTANSITFGKAVDTHGTDETSYGNLSGQGQTGVRFTSIGRVAGLSNTTDDFTGTGWASGFQQLGVNFTGTGSTAGQFQEGDNFSGHGMGAGFRNEADNVSILGFSSGTNNIYSNISIIGASAVASKNNQVVLGAFTTDEVYSDGAFVSAQTMTATAFLIASDSRLKTIGEIIKTEQINGNEVNLYYFTYNVNGFKSIGYVAQEVEDALQGLPQDVIDMIIVKKTGVDVNSTLNAINQRHSENFLSIREALLNEEIKNEHALQSIRDNRFSTISLDNAKEEYKTLLVSQELTSEQEDRLSRYNNVSWFYNVLEENKVIVNDIRSIDMGKLSLFK